jgi:hypothetical protein
LADANGIHSDIFVSETIRPDDFHGL